MIFVLIDFYLSSLQLSREQDTRLCALDLHSQSPSLPYGSPGERGWCRRGTFTRPPHEASGVTSVSEESARRGIDV